MNVATLTIKGDLSGPLSIEFASEGSSLPLAMTSPDDELRKRLFEGTASGREVADLLPQDLLRAVSQFYYVAGAASVLAIVSSSTALDVIPWERVPQSIGLSALSIVRVLPDQIAEPVDSDNDTRTALLVAGWTGARACA